MPRPVHRGALHAWSRNRHDISRLTRLSRCKPLTAQHQAPDAGRFWLATGALRECIGEHLEHVRTIQRMDETAPARAFMRPPDGSPKT